MLVEFAITRVTAASEEENGNEEFNTSVQKKPVLLCDWERRVRILLRENLVV